MSTDIMTRAYIITRLLMDKTYAEVSLLFMFTKNTIHGILSLAIQRGFDPNLRPLEIFDAFLVDASHSDRPKKQTPETEYKILAKVRFDRYGREKTCADIAGELSFDGDSISSMTVWQILE